MEYIDFQCQSSALQQLQQLSSQDKHSLLIEGSQGCGKTYLARQFARLIGCEDFQVIVPKVQDIRSAVEECYRVSSPIVLCFENLDLGVTSASYTLLKFLEEPLPHVYIVVSCRSKEHVPDTIVSRSVVVTVAPATASDLQKYAEGKSFETYFKFKTFDIWKSVRSFIDVDTLFSLSQEQIDYIQTMPQILKSNDSVSNLLWKFQKFPSGDPTPLELVIRYILYTEPKYWFIGHTCLQELAAGQIAAHAVIAKFLLDAKYAI